MSPVLDTLPRECWSCFAVKFSAIALLSDFRRKYLVALPSNGNQDMSGVTYLMQCSVLKPEMSLELVVKCDASDPAESAQLMATVLKDTLASYVR